MGSEKSSQADRKLLLPSTKCMDPSQTGMWNLYCFCCTWLAETRHCFPRTEIQRGSLARQQARKFEFTSPGSVPSFLYIALGHRNIMGNFAIWVSVGFSWWEVLWETRRASRQKPGNWLPQFVFTQDMDWQMVQSQSSPHDLCYSLG